MKTKINKSSINTIIQWLILIIMVAWIGYLQVQINYFIKNVPETARIYAIHGYEWGKNNLSKEEMVKNISSQFE